MIGKKKRRILIIILNILAVLLVCLAIFAARLLYLNSATKGDVIALKDCIFALNENYLNKMVNKYIENDIDIKFLGQVFK